MVYKWIQKQVEKAVKEYLDRLPDSIIIPAVAKVMNSQGLTEGNYKKLVETATGEKTVTIYFGNGDFAVISNGKRQDKGGPGW